MKCRVMGIVNVTPDSFSDGGRYFSPEEAVRRARNLVRDGADILDLGGESTRPGATPLAWQEEWARLEPVVFALLGQDAQTGFDSSINRFFDSSIELSHLGNRAIELSRGGEDDSNAQMLKCSNASMQSINRKIEESKNQAPLLSVDTYHPETAARALAAGVQIVNCVYPEPVAEMARLCEGSGAELVIPATARAAAMAHLPPERLYLDPMIGFGTTREEDLALLRGVGALAKEGRVLVGASRKRIVKKLTGEKMTGKNLGGNLGIAAWCAMNGASVVRVHDVKETVQALKVLECLSA